MTNFTPDQQAAIQTHHRNILVSASAGSGKTTVLVERIVQEVLAGQDLDRLLVVTFTNAATASMKLRIQKALKKVWNENQDDLTAAQKVHLRQQIAMAPAAAIMTLDAFSLRVVKEYYYAIDLDPGFRQLTDDSERQMLEDQVWNELRETLYQSDHQAQFIALTNNFASRQSDQGLADLVSELIHFAQTTTDPQQWLKNLAQPYAPAHFDDFFAANLWPQIKLAAQTASSQLEAILADLDEDVPALKKAADAIRPSLASLAALLNQGQPSYAKAQALVLAIDWPRWPATGKIDADIKAVKERAKDQRNAVKDTFTKACSEFVATAPADLTQALAAVEPLMQELSAVCLEFLNALANEKAARQLQTFSDIAQNALKILHATDRQTGAPISENFQAAFDEVLVDEYQDINPLQEALLQAVSTKHDRFMVGDVKQSIYGFRLAAPELFLKKYQDYQDLAKQTEPSQTDTRILLKENFRSARSVVSFTNLIFSQIMDKQVGELDYDANAQLVYAAKLPKDYAPAVNVLLQETDPQAQAPDAASDSGAAEAQADAEAEDPAAIAKADGEAQLVIAQIKGLVHNPAHQISDRKTGDLREIEYRDIQLLARSRSNNITIQSAFAKAGVPIVVADAQNYFKTTELMVMLSLLRLIDNPKQEIPLVAVLRSPIVGLDPNDLAAIRLAAPRAAFDEAMLTYAGEKHADASGQKVQHFISQLNDWRDFARENELSALIWRLYEDSGYLDYVGGMPGGAQRQANLRALAARAATYEAGGFKGLFAFIRFIEQMQKQDKDLALPVSLDPDTDAVSLATIHGSKGLEYPIVFLLDVDKKFNTRDVTGPAIVSKQFLGIKWIDPNTRQEYVLPQYLAAKLTKQRSTLAEEMRLLYVAITRTMDQLFIVGSVSDADKTLAAWQQAAQGDNLLLDAGVRQGAKCYLDWIGPALIRFETVSGEKTLPKLQQFGAKFTFNVLPQPQIAETAVVQPPADAPAAADLDAALAALNTPYPHALAAATTGFQSVSEIKRAFDDPDTLELTKSGAVLQQAGQRYSQPFAVPQFAETKGPNGAAAVGTATHLLLQQVDLSGKLDADSFSQLRDQLVKNGMLDTDVAAKINIAHLAALFLTPFGQEMQQNRATVLREVPFSLLLPAKRLFSDYQDAGLNPAGDDPQILVHGIIDGYFETDAGLILFDYKTDHIPGSVQPLVDKYRGQLNLYVQALQQMTPKKVLHAYLVLLESGEAVDVLAKASDE